MTAPLRFWDYVKAAFNLKVPVKGLGLLPVNKIMLAAFAILGFGLPGFWFLGLAAETAYLMALSGNGRFQKLVQLGQSSQVKQSWIEREQQILAMLDRDSQVRYQRLVQRCLGLVHQADPTVSATGLEDLKASGLIQLLWIFLKLLLSQRRVRDILGRTSLAELQEEIHQMEGKLAQQTENTPIYRSLKGTLDIQQRRLENLNKANENLKVNEAELDRIEKQVTLLAEETAISSDPAGVSVRLDGIMDSLQGTTKWMSENAEFFGSLEESSIPADLLRNPRKVRQSE